MSNRIMGCPNCGIIAALVELPEDTAADLLAAMLDVRRLAEGVIAQAYWCPHCDMPILFVWAPKVAVQLRRQLVGLPADLLKVDEEGGGA